MITNDYKKSKEAVLSLYEEFVKTVIDNKKEVNKSIAKQAEDIKKEQFSLMVVGEAKSGKSTFINSYLGKEILPMDVQQCTSSIIKIMYSDIYELEATNAAKGVTRIKGDKKIREFLTGHAALNDEYRCIPVTTINNELLIKARGKNILKKTMEEFLTGVVNDNIYNLPEDDYRNLIIKYVKENAAKWGKIITEIVIKYPLPDDMKGIVLIDSPGVNADGNVGLVAERYMENANAIIFVKSLNGQAIESSSFTNFLKSHSASRHKETMFLVLTGTSNLTKPEITKLKSQAVNMYGKTISKSKIICVDSKVQLFVNKCRELGREDLIDNYFSELKENNMSFAPARLCWLEAGKDFDSFEQEMMQLSNFNMVHETIEKFAHQANYILLLSFLKNLKSEYDRYRCSKDSQVNVLKESMEDPQQLELLISNKLDNINELYGKINTGVDAIQAKYEDNKTNEGIIVNKAEQKRNEYEDKLVNFKKLSASEITDDTFKELELTTLNQIEEIINLRRTLGNQIIEECNQQLIQLANNMDDIKSEAFSPTFTESDFEEINNEAHDNANIMKNIERGSTFFKTTEKVSVYSRAKHVRLVVDSISDRLEAITDTMKTNLLKYLANCCQKYREKLTSNIKELESDYKVLLNKKATVKTIQEQIQQYEGEIAAIDDKVIRLDMLRKGIENHVN